jgi:hypothetical protein
MTSLRQQRRRCCSPFSFVVLVLFLSTSSAFQNQIYHLVSIRNHLQKANDIDPVTRLHMSDERQPWNVFRFAQQSSRFVTLPPPFSSNNSSTKKIQPGDVLWKPSNIRNNFFPTFAPLDDVVMGGASSSQFNDATGKWTGTVTDANNGGFVGIRTTPNVLLDMSECRGIEIKLYSKKQQRIKVALRDSTAFNGIVWSTSVDVTNNGRPIKVPFDKQVPTLFARIDNTAKPFQKDNVTAMQLVYSKFEYEGALNPKFVPGEVDLQVEEIRAY